MALYAGLRRRVAEEVYKITSRWITEAAADPVLRYGKQQGAVLDPRSQTEDLGDDAREGLGVRHP